LITGSETSRREFGQSSARAENDAAKLFGGDLMENFLLGLGRVAGLAGAAIFVVAIAARFLGVYWLGGFQVGTIFQAAVAAMVFGCFCLLMVLAGPAGARNKP
jgi:hypothetical protein